MSQFQLATTICYGPDALNALSALDGKRVLVVTDVFMAKTALMNQVLERLGRSPVRVFDQVRPDPDVHDVALGMQALLDFGPDALLALGGGSPIDTAKAVRRLALDQGHGLSGGFVVIPSTSGSGSEVSSFAVVTEPTTDVKVPLTSPEMVADIAILDPEAVRTAPPGLTADAGMDAVSHAIEASVANGHNDFSDALAEKALRISLEELPTCFRAGDDIEAREHMQNAATMAAMAFENSGLGLVHGISHAIGGSFHVPHGRLNAMIMPHVMAFNAGPLGMGRGGLSSTARRYAALAGCLGLQATNERNSVLALIRRMSALRDLLKMPATLTEAGVDKGEYLAAIPHLALRARQDFCTSGNPVPAGDDALRAILRALA